MKITHELEENIEKLRKFVDQDQLNKNEKKYFLHLQSQISQNIQNIEEKYEEKLSFYDKIPKYLSSKLTKILIKLQEFKEQRDENILEQALKDLARRIAYQPWLPLHHQNYFQMEQKLNSTLFQDYKNRVRLDQDQESLDLINGLNEVKLSLFNEYKGGFINICDLDCRDLNCLKIIDEAKNYSCYKNMRELTIENKIQLLSDMRWCDFEVPPQPKIQRQHVLIQNLAKIENFYDYKLTDLRQESFKPHNFLKGKTVQNFIQNQQDLHYDPSSILHRQSQLKDLRNNYIELSDNYDEIDFKIIHQEQESIFDRIVRRCQEESYGFNNGRGAHNIQQNLDNEENILDNINIYEYIKESLMIPFDTKEGEIQIDCQSDEKQLQQLSSSKQLAQLISQLSSNKKTPCMFISNQSYGQLSNQANEFISSEHNFNIQSLEQQNNQELNTNLFEQEGELEFNYNSPNQQNINHQQNSQRDINSQSIKQNLIPKDNQYFQQEQYLNFNQSQLREQIKDIKFIENLNVNGLNPNLNINQSIYNQNEGFNIINTQKFGIIQTGNVNIEQESIQENSNNFSINQLMSFCSEQYPSRIESPKSKNIYKKQQNSFFKNNLANKANNILDALQEKSSDKKDYSLKLSDDLKYYRDYSEQYLSKLLIPTPEQNQILCKDISSISLNKNINKLKSSSEQSDTCEGLLPLNLNRKLEFSLSPESVICEQQEQIYDLDNIRHTFIKQKKSDQEKNQKKLSFFKCEDINITLTNISTILNSSIFWEQFELIKQEKIFRGEGQDFHQYQKDYLRPSQANFSSSQLSVKPPFYDENQLIQRQMLQNSILFKEKIFEEPQLEQIDNSKSQCNYYQNQNQIFIVTQCELNGIYGNQDGLKIKNRQSKQNLEVFQNLQDQDFFYEEFKQPNNENLDNLRDISYQFTQKNVQEQLKQAEKQEKDKAIDILYKVNKRKGGRLNLFEGYDIFQKINQNCLTFQEKKHQNLTHQQKLDINQQNFNDLKQQLLGDIFYFKGQSESKKKQLGQGIFQCIFQIFIEQNNESLQDLVLKDLVEQSLKMEESKQNQEYHPNSPIMNLEQKQFLDNNNQSKNSTSINQISEEDQLDLESPQIEQSQGSSNHNSELDSQQDYNFDSPLHKSKNKQIFMSTPQKNQIYQIQKENQIAQQETRGIHSSDLKTHIRSKNIDLSDFRLQASFKEAQKKFIFDSNFKNDICVRQFDFDDEAQKIELASNLSNDEKQHTQNRSDKQQSQNKQKPHNESSKLRYFDLTNVNTKLEDLFENFINQKEASKSGYNLIDNIYDENTQENPWLDNLQQQHIIENSSNKNNQNIGELGFLLIENQSKNDYEQPKIEINNRFQLIMKDVDTKVQERFLDYQLRGVNSKYKIPLHLQRLKDDKEKLFDQFREESEKLDEYIKGISDLTKLISYNIQNNDKEHIDTEKRNQQYKNQEIDTFKRDNIKLNERDTEKNKNNNPTQIKEFDFKITDFEQKDIKILKKQDGLLIKSEKQNYSSDNEVMQIFDKLQL